MNTARIAVIASVLALVLVVADSVAIASSGGSGDSPLDLILFLAGLLALLVSVAALGLHWSTGRGRPVRVLACAGLLSAAILLAAVVQ
ncbi:MAG: hypothetical protein ACRDPB_09615, partial [Nocardioidaceae bacterium]